MESVLWTEKMEVEKYIKLSVCFCFLLFPFPPHPSLALAVTTPLPNAEVPAPSLHMQNSYNISKLFCLEKAIKFLTKTKIKSKEEKKPHLFYPMK